METYTHNEYRFLGPQPYSQENKHLEGASASDLLVKPEGPTLPEGFAGAGGAIAETKAAGTCGVVGRGVCPATAKGRSRSIRIAGVFCSTA